MTFVITNLARWSNNEEHTPQSKIDCNVLSSWETLHQDIGGILSDEVSNIENTNQKAVLLAFKLVFGDNAICCCV